MKNRFLLLGSLIVSGSLFAQMPVKKVDMKHEFSAQLTPAEAPYTVNEGLNTQTEGLGPVLFEEDFANGAGQWLSSTITGYSSSAVWVYRGPNTTPSNAVGSEGAYAGPGTPINSATASDGFMIMDSDWYDNGGTAGNFGGGSAPAPHGAALTSPDIDCSGENGVVLTFHSFYRQYDAHGYVIVSNDNFSTADTVYDASDFHDVNTAGPSDELVKVDISSTAAQSSTVKVRFLFLAAGNANPSGYYYWMFDDVTVTGAADFDMSIEERYYNGAGGNSSGAEAFADAQYARFYYQIPMSQADGFDLTFATGVRNLSDATNPNVQLTATVSGAGTFSGTSTPVSYSNFGERDSINANTTFSPSAMGQYNVTWEVDGDSIDDFPGDNIVSDSFNVVERTMSWDDGNIDGGVSWSNGSHGMLSRMDIVNQDTLAEIHYGIWSSATFASDDGATVQVGIWKADANGDIDLNSPLWSTFRTMTSSEYSDGTNNNIIEVGLDAPLALEPGEYYSGYLNTSGVIRTAYTDRSNGSGNAFLVIGGDIAGWTDYNPIIHLIFWSSELCAGTNLVVDGDIICNPDEWTADIDAFATNGDGNYTFEWSTGATTEDITVDEEGIYTLTVTDGNFCTATAEFDVNNADVNCNLSTGELGSTNFNFTVMPNPSNGVFNLTFEAERSESVTVEMQSLKGETVYSDVVTVGNATNRSIDVSGIASGVYLVKVTGESGTMIEKVMVQ